MNCELIIPGNYEETINFCVEHFKKSALKAINNHGNFYVALSGGETPKVIFQQLSHHKNDIPWEKVHLFWSDERCVTPTDKDSNYKMAMDAGLNGLIKPENIHRIMGENDPQIEAQRYEELIQKIVPHSKFDLVTLGIGEDGHTASLFPHTEALHIKNHLVAANFVPSKNSWRITFTYPCINSSHEIVIYALGEKKAQIIKNIFQEPNKYPIQKIGTEKNKSKLISDKAATYLLP